MGEGKRWKILVLLKNLVFRGGHAKPIYRARGGDCQKRGAWTVCRFKGGAWWKRGGGAFEGGLIPQCTLYVCSIIVSCLSWKISHVAPCFDITGNFPFFPSSAFIINGIWILQLWIIDCQKGRKPIFHFCQFFNLQGVKGLFNLSVDLCIYLSVGLLYTLIEHLDCGLLIVEKEASQFSIFISFSTSNLAQRSCEFVSQSVHQFVCLSIMHLEKLEIGRDLNVTDCNFFGNSPFRKNVPQY